MKLKMSQSAASPRRTVALPRLAQRRKSGCYVFWNLQVHSIRYPGLYIHTYIHITISININIIINFNIYIYTLTVYRDLGFVSAELSEVRGLEEQKEL